MLICDSACAEKCEKTSTFFGPAAATKATAIKAGEPQVSVLGPHTSRDSTLHYDACSSVGFIFAA